jgi:hypothetical protein
MDADQCRTAFRPSLNDPSPTAQGTPQKKGPVKANTVELTLTILVEKTCDRLVNTRPAMKDFRFVLMSMCSYMVFRTPGPDRSCGTHWFRSVCASEWRRRHRRSGHVFVGRLYAHVIEGRANRRTVRTRRRKPPFEQGSFRSKTKPPFESGSSASDGTPTDSRLEFRGTRRSAEGSKKLRRTNPPRS